MKLAYRLLVLANLAAQLPCQAEIPRLIADLETTDAAKQRAAVAALVRKGTVAVPALTELATKKEAVEEFEELFGRFGGRRAVPFPRRDWLAGYRLWGKHAGADVRYSELTLWNGVLTEDASLDGTHDARVLAAYALGRIGEDAAPSVTALLEKMRATENDTLGTQIAWTLARIGAPALPALIGAMDDMDARRALVELGATSRPRLLEVLANERAPRRLDAAFILGWMSPHGAEQIVPALAAQLASRSKPLADHVMAALGHWGEAARPALEAALRHERSTVRLRALATLCRRMPSEASTRCALRMLTDDNTTVARYACEVLGKSARTLSEHGLVGEARDALTRAYEDGDLLVRLGALFGLADLREPGTPATAAAHDAYTSGKWQLELAATLCLTRADAPRVLEPTLARLRGRLRAPVRYRMLDMLARWELRGARANKVAAAFAAMWPKARNDQERHEMLEVLARLGPDAEPALPVILDAFESKLLRNDALHALAALGKAAAPAAPRLIRGLAEDGKPQEAARILGALGEQREALDRLFEGMEDAGGYPLTLLVRAIGELQLDGTLANEAATKLRARQKDSPTPRLRAAIVETLGKLPGGLDDLRRALADDDSGVRLQAIQSLKALGRAAAPALPALRQIVQSEAEQWLIDKANEAIKAIEAAR